MARILIPLWQNWQFVNTFEEQYVRADCDESHFTEVLMRRYINLSHVIEKNLPYPPICKG